MKNDIAGVSKIFKDFLMPEKKEDSNSDKRFGFNSGFGSWP